MCLEKILIPKHSFYSVRNHDTVTIFMSTIHYISCFNPAKYKAYTILQAWSQLTLLWPFFLWAAHTKVALRHTSSNPWIHPSVASFTDWHLFTILVFSISFVGRSVLHRTIVSVNPLGRHYLPHPAMHGWITVSHNCLHIKCRFVILNKLLPQLPSWYSAVPIAFSTGNVRVCSSLVCDHHFCSYTLYFW